MRDALDALDLIVCVDIYRNATGEHADYVLPAAGAFERADVNMPGLGMQYTPNVQYTDAVVPPAYERRHDWWIYEKLAQTMGLPSAFDADETPDMWGRINAMLKSRGHSLADLREAGVIALEHSRPEDLYAQVQTESGLVDCCPPLFASGIERMSNIFEDLKQEPGHQLKLITKRDSYSFNSWYANVAKLKTGEHADNYLYMSPSDAELRQLREGSKIRVSNSFGALETTLKLTDSLRAGVVAMNHGWGQGRSSGMRVAQSHPGVNCNVLLPSGRESFEPLSNQSHMTGIAIEVTEI